MTMEMGISKRDLADGTGYHDKCIVSFESVVAPGCSALLARSETPVAA